VLALWVGRVPTVYYLAFVAGFEQTGIWIGMALGNVVGAIGGGLWFLRGTWKRAIVDDSPATSGEPGPSVED